MIKPHKIPEAPNQQFLQDSEKPIVTSWLKLQFFLTGDAVYNELAIAVRESGEKLWKN